MKEIGKKQVVLKFVLGLVIGFSSAIPQLSSDSLAAGTAGEVGAEFNYMVACRGCHQVSGDGVQTSQDYIPPLKNSIGKFLQIPGGREYLVRVPGVSQSGLDDEETAILLNYLIERFAGTSHPNSYQPFTKEEVAEKRAGGPLREVIQRRSELLALWEAQSTQKGSAKNRE